MYTIRRYDNVQYGKIKLIIKKSFKKTEFVTHNALITVLSLQNLIQYHDDGVTDFNHRLYDKIDLTRFVDNADVKGFIGLVKEQRFEFFNPHYPTSSAHQWYINNYILPKITNANSLS